MPRSTADSRAAAKRASSADSDRFAELAGLYRDELADLEADIAARGGTHDNLSAIKVSLDEGHDKDWSDLVKIYTDGFAGMPSKYGALRM